MYMGKDALLGASKMILLLQDMAIKVGDPMVATVGKLVIVPGTSNVIPGMVRFSIDLRHCDENILEAFEEDVKKRFAKLAFEEGLHYSFQCYMKSVAIPMDKTLQQELLQICEDKEIPCLSMVSGAGHDAQNFAEHIPTALLFVPSIAGISHNPLEDTKIEDLVAGVEVLTEFMRCWAY